MGDKGPLLLRDFLLWRFETIERELHAIRGALEKMAEKPVSLREFDSLKLQVAGLAEGLKELEERTKALEHHKGMASWLARQALVIAIIVVIIYLMGVMR